MKKSLQKISKYRPSILQGRLDLSATRGHFSFTIEHPLEQRAFQVLCALLGVLIFCYLYFVSASVLNIMASREADASIAKIQSTIASLEQQYFALGQEMNQSSAVALGLTPLRDTQYVYVPTNTASAGTLAKNEI